MKLVRDVLLRPSKLVIAEALRAGLVVDITHLTEGRFTTDRGVLPVTIGTYTTQAGERRTYFRGYHLRGTSHSGAGSLEWRLFLLNNTVGLTWTGSWYNGTPSGYNPNDSFFTQIQLAYNAKRAKTYREENGY